jgi:hypothetical protein
VFATAESPAAMGWLIVGGPFSASLQNAAIALDRVKMILPSSRVVPDAGWWVEDAAAVRRGRMRLGHY